MSNENEAKVTCKSCNQDRVKKFLKYHKAPTADNSTKRRKKFVDESGRMWHGTKCPECASQWRINKHTKKEMGLKTELLEALDITPLVVDQKND